ncbi:MAG: ROK family protein [Litoreibacter sp.]
MTSAGDSITLVADIGGTNTRLALAQDTRVKTDTVLRYPNAEFDSFRHVAETYLETQRQKCVGACVAIAGPVKDGCGALTNLGWSIDEPMLRDLVNADNVGVFNDLQAQGYGLGNLTAGAVSHISGPEPEPAGTKLVIGVGTGFNIATVLETPHGRIIPPAEAGHIALPTRSAEQRALVASFEENHGFAAVEDMLSGRGFERIYAHLSDGNSKTSSQIMTGFEDGSDPIAVKSAEMFVAMLGTVAGDLSLVSLPFGGIYFAGGMARALSGHFNALQFDTHFHDKGRFAEFVANFSIHVIEDDYAALTGCASYLAARQSRVGSNP